MNNISSPRTDDHGIDHELRAKGLNAPRITMQAIEANIASEHYFTAAEGMMASLELTGTTPGYRQGERAVDLADLIPKSLDLLTFCVIVLRNGFTVTGKSACASPANFDAEIGQRIARANAVQKIWPLMGYELRTLLAAAAQADAAWIGSEG